MDEDFGDDADYGAAFAAAETSRPPPRNVPTGGPAKVVQPKPQALPTRQGPAAILVSTRQKGNPILNHVRSLPWEYSDIPADYVLGATTCALFLSLKYHRLHPEYVYSRIRALGGKYNLRVLLTMVDIQNHEEALRELSKTSMINNLTIILAWSAQEAGHYLELFKSYEHASPASIRAHQAESYKESLTEFVTTPRSINKTDAASLISNFGSLQAAVNAQPEELALVPGWGEKKVKAWCATVREPFRVRRTAKAVGARLNRNDSTMSIGQDSREDSAQGSNRPTPIPIATVPSFSREPTRPDSAARRTPERTGSTLKRSALAVEDSVDEDDEDALLAAAEAEEQKASSSTNATEKSNSNMSEGVMAALAKLREDG